MGESGHVRLRDVRAIYRLLGECCELGSDPLVWRAHMLRGLSRILGAQVAICGTALPPQDQSAMALVPDTFVHLGWATEGDRDRFVRWLHDSPPDIDPLVSHMAQAVPRACPSLTCKRSDIVGDTQWYGSKFYNEFYRASHLDDRLESFFWHADSRAIDGICFIRPQESSRFDDRGRKLLRIFHQEVCRLLGTRLAHSSLPSVATLAPRLRQVLMRLLQGDSEKQIGMRLQISRHTVHEHVKKLHSYFKVSSRGELLARCSRLLPVLEALDAAQLAVDSNAAISAFSDAFRIE
jgi:DNA-binding CsgD family transcriptional regulator